MNAFEKKIVELEVLEALARRCTDSIEWYMEYDEEGNKVMPTDERSLYTINVYQGMISKLEKMI